MNPTKQRRQPLFPCTAFSILPINNLLFLREILKITKKPLTLQLLLNYINYK